MDVITTKMNFLRKILKPKVCYRKDYVVEKYEKPCNCIGRCKFPPPGPPAKIPVEERFKIDYYPLSHGPFLRGDQRPF